MKSVFGHYVKNLEKIEREEKILKKYSEGSSFNGIKKDASEKRLKLLQDKEQEHISKFTLSDKKKAEERFGIIFSED